MRVRLREPKGSSTLTLEDDATIGDLIREIKNQTGITAFDVKYGYPPRPLCLGQKDNSQLLKKLEVKLDGEQLIISPRDHIHKNPTSSIGSTQEANPARSLSKLPELPHSHHHLIALNKKSIDEVPEVPMPDRGATVVLRVMPSDNSCLFRAIGTALLPGDDSSMLELRSLVAGVIQAEQDIFTHAILEKSPDDYCRWIQNPESWGGAIELGILSKHFDVEICSIDVQSLRIDKFNEGRPTRCILVYSGIHYDIIAQSPSSPPDFKSYSPPDMDQRVWSRYDDEILAKALELCKKLQAKKYYTNPGSMSIKCNVCGVIVNGEQQAAQHAQQSGHYDMVEVAS